MAVEALFAPFVNHPVSGLFLIVTLGTLLGAIAIRGISLGRSGVLFIALALGHFGLSVPKAIATLGVVLFVYAVGLQAGPRFVQSFRKRGLSYVMVTLTTLSVAATVAYALAITLGIDGALATGLFAGALTTTPGLAAAIEAIGNAHVSVGYGIAYPFGIVGVILFSQIVPKLLRTDLKAEARKVERQMTTPQLEVAWLEVKNPQLDNTTIDALSRAELTSGTISRISNATETVPARSDAVLHLGDRLRVVATQADLQRLELLVGPRLQDVDEPPSSIVSRTIVVTSERMAGKPLGELQIRQRYGVNITRLYRDDLELVPTSKATLEIGDTIRVVGDEADCDRFVAEVGQHERRLLETRFFPLSLGLLLGVILGRLPLRVAKGVVFRLGNAGGPLLVALLAGHLGRLRSLSFRIPRAALFFVREIGLIFFLAGAGTSAGKNVVDVVSKQGWLLVCVGALLTLAPLLVAWFLSRRALSMDTPSALGLICGSMTSTPGLGVVTSQADSDVPVFSYATVYPAALVFVTLLSQILAMLLR